MDMTWSEINKSEFLVNCLKAHLCHRQMGIFHSNVSGCRLYGIISRYFRWLFAIRSRFYLSNRKWRIALFQSLNIVTISGSNSNGNIIAFLISLTGIAVLVRQCHFCRSGIIYILPCCYCFRSNNV